MFEFGGESEIPFVNVQVSPDGFSILQNYHKKESYSKKSTKE
jgi:hypothetical protein